MSVLCWNPFVPEVRYTARGSLDYLNENGTNCII